MAAFLAAIPLILEFLQLITMGFKWWLSRNDEQRAAVKLAFKEFLDADDKKNPGSVRHSANRMLDTL